MNKFEVFSDGNNKIIGFNQTDRDGVCFESSVDLQSWIDKSITKRCVDYFLVFRGVIVFHPGDSLTNTSWAESKKSPRIGTGRIGVKKLRNN
jgi:hypothetical protein